MTSYDMKKENNKLNELMGRQPFRVPDGYFEGFTDDFMSRLPEKVVPKAKKVSFYDRAKPLLYMAAMFIGAIALFNLFDDKESVSPDAKGGTLVATIANTSSNNAAETEDDVDFLEYIEDMYADKYALSYMDDFMDNW